MTRLSRAALFTTLSTFALVSLPAAALAQDAPAAQDEAITTNEDVAPEQTIIVTRFAQHQPYG